MKLKARRRFTTRGGTGSGLHLNRMLLREIRGKMKIESKKGKGTKVTISIPIKK